MGVLSLSTELSMRGSQVNASELPLGKTARPAGPVKLLPALPRRSILGLRPRIFSRP